MYRSIVSALIVLFVLGCKQGDSSQNQIAKNENSNAVSNKEPEKRKSKDVEIVFCLDATGSMSGLIGTAKEKIWDIVSELAQSEDVDSVKMGMVFYRDRNDSFVTKQIQLTTELDEVYSDLLAMTADGGGDSPESVNQALNEAVENMNWSDKDTTYRSIFVVGDCPPHMDYQDDVLYTVSCKKAQEKGIVINSIKLGNSCQDAIPHFKAMAHCSQGDYLQLDQNAKDYSIETPYDEEINDISMRLDASRVYYGNAEEQKESNLKKAKSMEVYDKASKTANSARASYNFSTSGNKSWKGNKELLSDYKEGKVKLEEIEEDDLPSILKGKTKEEKEAVLEELQEKRENDKKRLKDLSKKRKGFITEKEKAQKDTTSFSKEVIKIMKKQSKKKSDS